jgi:hypothetical protein
MPALRLRPRDEMRGTSNYFQLFPMCWLWPRLRIRKKRRHSPNYATRSSAEYSWLGESSMHMLRCARLSLVSHESTPNQSPDVDWQARSPPTPTANFETIIRAEKRCAIMRVALIGDVNYVLPRCSDMQLSHVCGMTAPTGLSSSNLGSLYSLMVPNLLIADT